MRPIYKSLMIHFISGGLIFSLALALSPEKQIKKLVEFRVIEATGKPLKKTNVMPLKSAPLRQIKKIKKKAKKKDVGAKRKVFGVSKKSLRSDETSSIKTKTGNTIAKKIDQKKLKKGDEESLPIPEEDYMVTAMPRVLSEYRNPYPKEAKEKGIEGKVILEILIDNEGKVRKATLVYGPGFGLNEAALASIKKFKFVPAQIGDQAVAVVIRYGINFVLEE
jgi:TonB family protein